jgi:hypothetical protein
MLTINDDQSSPYCDGLSRRSFLRVGGLAAGALTLPELLRSKAAAGQAARSKSVIMICLGGGPSQSPEEG